MSVANWAGQLWAFLPKRCAGLVGGIHALGGFDIRQREKRERAMVAPNAQHAALAMKLRGLPPHQNPVLNKHLIKSLPANVQPHVEAIANDAGLSALATSGAATTTPPNGNGQPLTLGPQNQRLVRNERHNLLPFVPVAVGSITAATPFAISATPYVPFKPSRCVISPGTITGNIIGSNVSQWQVGAKPQYVSLGAEQIDMFAAGSHAGFLDFDWCPPTVAITGQLTLAAAQAFSGVFIGQAKRSKDSNRPSPDKLKVQRLPIPQTIVAAGATAQIQVPTTIPFWPRKIALTEPAGVSALFGYAVGTGASAFDITGLFCGSDPQFMSAPPVSGGTMPACPAIVLTPIFNLGLDLDMMDTAIPMIFNVHNNTAANAYFGGVVEGEVERSRIASSNN